MHIFQYAHAGPSILGKRPIHQLHGSSSDNRIHPSHKRERGNTNAGGALFDLNVPPEVADKI
jgi:ariadne-1